MLFRKANVGPSGLVCDRFSDGKHVFSVTLTSRPFRTVLSCHPFASDQSYCELNEEYGPDDTQKVNGLGKAGHSRERRSFDGLVVTFSQTDMLPLLPLAKTRSCRLTYVRPITSTGITY